MRYSEFEGEARYTAHERAYDAWAQTADYGREREEWTASCMERFLSDTGLGAFSDVVGFEAGAPARAMRDADAALTLDYSFGPAWGDEDRLDALLRHLCANPVTSGWLLLSNVPEVPEGAPDRFSELSSILIELLMAVCDKAPFPYFNLSSFEEGAYALVGEMLEEGALDCEFSEDGELVG